MYNKLSVDKLLLRKFLKDVDVIKREPVYIKIAAWSTTNDDDEVIDILSKVQSLMKNEQLDADILNKGFYSVTLIVLKVQLEKDLLIVDVQTD